MHSSLADNIYQKISRAAPKKLLICRKACLDDKKSERSKRKSQQQGSVLSVFLRISDLHKPFYAARCCQVISFLHRHFSPVENYLQTMHCQAPPDFFVQRSGLFSDQI